MAASANEWFFYGECMRNHGVRHGRAVTDGCCEFTLNQNTPNFQLCEACGCHRNFHRKIPHNGSVNQGNNQQRSEQVPPKRVRRVFSREQKERMRIFAEDLQWKMDKNRRHEIDRFCQEIGVPRQNFRTWMQNHKRTSTSVALASMPHPQPASASASASGTPDIASSSLALAP